MIETAQELCRLLRRRFFPGTLLHSFFGLICTVGHFLVEEIEFFWWKRSGKEEWRRESSSTNLDSCLETAGFERGGDGIFRQPDPKPFGYSDGSRVEQKLLMKISKTTEVSVDSPALRKLAKGWVAEYHLSPLRANLLRPFAAKLSGDVLELGGGCGAITRYLGEQGARVVSVEGSDVRAQIASQRTRDLPMVSHVVSEISEFTSEQKFDCVLLVGVLEYAPMFIQEKDPQIALLRHAASFLKDSGVLLLAIENQLGLKYFAGAREDHLLRPMVGIENRYSKEGPRTFTKSGLQKILRKAGFRKTYFHSPVPDYKFPRSFVFQDGLTTDEHDFSDIFGLVGLTDKQLPSDPAFNPMLVWPVIGEAGLSGQFCNSFLVEAHLQETESLVMGAYAAHFGEVRAKQRAGAKVFVREGKTMAVKEVDNFEVGAERGLSAAHSEVFLEGALVVSEIVGRLTYGQWTADDLATEVSEYLASVGKWAQTRGYFWVVENGEVICDSRLLDAIPSNAKIVDGSLELFDLEWTHYNSIPMSWLAFRVVHDIVRRSVPWQPKKSRLSLPSRESVARRVYRKLGFSFFEYWRASVRESSFQTSVYS